MSKHYVGNRSGAQWNKVTRFDSLSKNYHKTSQGTCYARIQNQNHKKRLKNTPQVWQSLILI